VLNWVLAVAAAVDRDLARSHATHLAYWNRVR